MTEKGVVMKRREWEGEGVEGDISSRMDSKGGAKPSEGLCALSV